MIIESMSDGENLDLLQHHEYGTLKTHGLPADAQQAPLSFDAAKKCVFQ